MNLAQNIENDNGKPFSLPVLPENIPDELKRLHKWVCWRWEWRRDKKGKWSWTKPPYQINGRTASSNDPTTWNNFDACLKAYQGGGFDGIGIVLDGTDGIVGIDLDHFIDNAGDIGPEAQRIIEAAASYTERSPSGDGFRIMFYGSKPGKRCKAGDLEMYSTVRYLTITGQHLAGTPETLQSNQSRIDKAYKLMFPEPKPSKPKDETQGRERASTDKTDAELLDAMFRSAKGAKRRSLWEGDIDAYPSPSEADMALCGALAWWTDNDAERMDALFRQSGLMRDKWDEKRPGGTYGSVTIQKALENNHGRKKNSLQSKKEGNKGNKGNNSRKHNRNKDVTDGSFVTPQEATEGNMGNSRFKVTDDGVFFQDFDKDGEPKPLSFLCSRLDVLAQTRASDQTSWGLLLQWKDGDGHVHRWAAPSRGLIGDGGDFFRELADRGLKIAPGQKARNRIIEYLTGTEIEKRSLCTEKIGWHGASFVLPHRTIGGGEVIFQSEMTADNPFETAGTLEEWRQQVSSLCCGNSRLILALSAAFAPILLDITGDENGGLHYVGSSSTGKSTVADAAGSVWGKGIKQTWNSTTNGLGATACTFNDALMVLDELSQCDAKTAGETAYLLANGIEKGRAMRNGGMKRRRRWRMIFLSNGEIDLAQHLIADGKKIKAGQDVRLLTIPADAGAGFGIFEDLHGFISGADMADALKSVSSRYYGVAAVEFVSQVAAARDKVRDVVVRMKKDFLEEYVSPDAESQARRAAERFALIGIAGELATSYGITGWTVGESVDAAARCFQAWLDWRGGYGNAEEKELLRTVQEHFEQCATANYANITETEPYQKPLFGFRELADDESVKFYVLPTAFNSVLCKGFEKRRAKKTLQDAGVLVSGADGKPTVVKRLPGYSNPKRCYLVRVEGLNDES